MTDRFNRTVKIVKTNENLSVFKICLSELIFTGLLCHLVEIQGITPALISNLPRFKSEENNPGFCFGFCRQTVSAQHVGFQTSGSVRGLLQLPAFSRSAMIQTLLTTALRSSSAAGEKTPEEEEDQLRHVSMSPVWTSWRFLPERWTKITNNTEE